VSPRENHRGELPERSASKRIDWTSEFCNNGGMENVLASETYLSTHEVAEALGLTDGRICQMIRAGQIRAQRLGKHSWAIPNSEIQRLLDARKQGDKG